MTSPTLNAGPCAAGPPDPPVPPPRRDPAGRPTSAARSGVRGAPAMPSFRRPGPIHRLPLRARRSAVNSAQLPLSHPAARRYFRSSRSLPARPHARDLVAQHVWHRWRPSRSPENHVPDLQTRLLSRSAGRRRLSPRRACPSIPGCPRRPGHRLYAGPQHGATAGVDQLTPSHPSPWWKESRSRFRYCRRWKRGICELIRSIRREY